MCALDVRDIREQVESMRTTVRAKPPISTPPSRATLEMVRLWEDTVAKYGLILRRTDALLRDVRVLPDDMADVRDPLLREMHEIRASAFDAMRSLNPDQAWFWTEEWQAGEREADSKLDAGRSTFHEDTASFLAALDAMDRDADIRT
jgi:hypothetical protein